MTIPEVDGTGGCLLVAAPILAFLSTCVIGVCVWL